jgi:hypothetical protein
MHYGARWTSELVWTFLRRETSCSCPARYQTTAHLLSILYFRLCTDCAVPARNLLRNVGNKSFIPLPPSAQLQRLRYIVIFIYLFFVISHCVIGTPVHCFSGITLNYPTGQNFANYDAPQRRCIMLADSKFGR